WIKAADNIQENELDELKNEYAYYEAKMIGNKLMDKAISEVTKKFNISGIVDIVMTAIGIDSGKKESGKNIEIKEALRSASKLGLEVSISQQSSGGGLSIQLYPVDETLIRLSVGNS